MWGFEDKWIFTMDYHIIQSRFLIQYAQQIFSPSYIEKYHSSQHWGFHLMLNSNILNTFQLFYHLYRRTISEYVFMNVTVLNKCCWKLVQRYVFSQFETTCLIVFLTYCFPTIQPPTLSSLFPVLPWGPPQLTHRAAATYHSFQDAFFR